ncbi:MAG: M23 family metallopeptidase [Treponema sp.]|nr:M23 family metallopeptidase [Treponema sp.]
MRENILRILLIFAVVFYTFDGRFFPVFQEGTIFKSVQAQTEQAVDNDSNAEGSNANGMGGSALSDEAEFLASLLTELEEHPAHEDFSRPRTLAFDFYTLRSGDMIGVLATQAGLNEDTLISANNIRNTRLVQIGQVIRIPNQDGIYYAVQTGDNLEGIAQRHNTSVSHISVANELFSGAIRPGDMLFVPGARMDWVARQEINGDLFIWPTVGRVSSGYGFRISPITHTRHFHAGLDISSPMGTPVRAAMAGRVLQVGYDHAWGHFVLVGHHSGYRTFYAHMSVVRVRPGANVATGERIGDMGSTGLSTGPHLHFTVYRNGITVNPRTLMR